MTVSDAMPYFLTEIDPETLAKLGHQLEEILEFCLYDSELCGVMDFKPYLDESAGNCFTFNAEEKHRRQSRRAGEVYGLSVQLYTNQSEYLSTTTSAGMQIVIHEPGQTVIAENQRLIIPSGYLTAIALKKVRKNFLLNAGILRAEVLHLPVNQ